MPLSSSFCTFSSSGDWRAGPESFKMGSCSMPNYDGSQWIVLKDMDTDSKEEFSF